jgi:hypothetical protein
MNRLVYLVGFLFASIGAFSQDDKSTRYSAMIDSSNLKSLLYELASDQYEGRETGEKGQKMAAEFLKIYYEKLGLTKIVDNQWEQLYPLKRESFQGSTAKTGDIDFQYIDDFYMYGIKTETLPCNDVIWLGYGIQTEKYNDYKKKTVTGKVLLCMSGEPINGSGISRVTTSYELSEWSSDWTLKAKAAEKAGATALIIINRDYEKFMKRARYWFEQSPLRLDRSEEEEGEYNLPVIFISPEMCAKWLAGKGAHKIKKQILRGEAPLNGEIKKPLTFHMKRNTDNFTASNVMAFIPGSDPVKKEEVVVLSAHYDHVGVIKGEIHNGADDDGSGTVMLMELARVFQKAKEEGNGPARSLLFLHVSGEEKGLLGSEWYADHPILPLEKTICNLNVDMIGRKDVDHKDANYVYLIGSDKLSSRLHQISEVANTKYTQLQLDYTYNDPNDPNRFYYRSDHYNFAKKGIPVIFYFSGVHEDYHKPGDDPEKIMYGKMSRIGKLIFHTAWEAANIDGGLPVDSNKE